MNLAQRALRTWLFLIALSFVVGILIIVAYPPATSVANTLGVSANVALALTIGAFLGWARAWRHLVYAIVWGSLVTVLASGLLALVTPGYSALLAGILPVALIAICTALTGMSVLVGGAAAVAVTVQALGHLGHIVGRSTNQGCSGLGRRGLAGAVLDRLPVLGDASALPPSL